MFFRQGASSEAGRFAGGMTMFVGLLFSVPLLIWLVIIWGIYGENRAWRGRAWLALLPSALLFSGNILETAFQPPREQRLRKRFQLMFHAELPTDARNIDATYPTLADSGHVDFVFRCSKASAYALITAMNLKAGEGEPPHYSRLAPERSEQLWIDTVFFFRVDRRGVGYLLITDSRMELIVMARNPLFAKSEDDSNELE